MKVHPQSSFQHATGRSSHADGNGQGHDRVPPRRSGAKKVLHEIRPQHAPSSDTHVADTNGPSLHERIEVGNRVGTFLTANVDRLTERFVNSDDYSEVQRRQISGFIAGFEDKVGSLMDAYSRGEIDREAVKHGVLDAFGSMNGAIRDAIAEDTGAGGPSEIRHGLDGVDVSA